MASLDYDLDTNGGLMNQILALTAPPGSRDRSDNNGSGGSAVESSSSLSAHPYFKRPGRGHNRDCCDACGEGGDLICCDICPASFHLICHDPPLFEEDIPMGEWGCYQCKINEGDDDGSSGSSRGSGSSKLNKGVKRKDKDDDKSGTKPDKLDKINMSNACSKSEKANGASSTNFNLSHNTMCNSTSTMTSMTTSSFSSIRTVNSSISAVYKQVNRVDLELSPTPFHALVFHAATTNPKQFELPYKLTIPIAFPGEPKVQARPNGRRLPSYKKKSSHEKDNCMVQLPAKLCFMCNRSCRVGALLGCDYCPLLFHLDCLDPPLTTAPSHRWMCPNHPEHFLDEHLLPSCRITDRVQLWERCRGLVDQAAVQRSFFNKLHRPHPPRTHRVKRALRATVRVPPAIKEAYRNPASLLPALPPAHLRPPSPPILPAEYLASLTAANIASLVKPSPHLGLLSPLHRSSDNGDDGRPGTADAADDDKEEKFSCDSAAVSTSCRSPGTDGSSNKSALHSCALCDSSLQSVAAASDTRRNSVSTDKLTSVSTVNTSEASFCDGEANRLASRDGEASTVVSNKGGTSTKIELETEEEDEDDVEDEGESRTALRDEGCLLARKVALHTDMQSLTSRRIMSGISAVAVAAMAVMAEGKDETSEETEKRDCANEGVIVLDDRSRQVKDFSERTENDSHPRKRFKKNDENIRKNYTDCLVEQCDKVGYELMGSIDRTEKLFSADCKSNGDIRLDHWNVQVDAERNLENNNKIHSKRKEIERPSSRGSAKGKYLERRAESILKADALQEDGFDDRSTKHHSMEEEEMDADGMELHSLVNCTGGNTESQMMDVALRSVENCSSSTFDVSNIDTTAHASCHANYNSPSGYVYNFNETEANLKVITNVKSGSNCTDSHSNTNVCVAKEFPGAVNHILDAPPNSEDWASPIMDISDDSSAWERLEGTDSNVSKPSMISVDTSRLPSAEVVVTQGITECRQIPGESITTSNNIIKEYINNNNNNNNNNINNCSVTSLSKSNKTFTIISRIQSNNHTIPTTVNSNIFYNTLNSSNKQNHFLGSCSKTRPTTLTKITQVQTPKSAFNQYTQFRPNSAAVFNSSYNGNQFGNISGCQGLSLSSRSSSSGLGEAGVSTKMDPAQTWTSTNNTPLVTCYTYIPSTCPVATETPNAIVGTQSTSQGVIVQQPMDVDALLPELVQTIGEPVCDLTYPAEQENAIVSHSKPTDTEVKEWLSGLVSFQASIAKYVLKPELPSSDKTPSKSLTSTSTTSKLPVILTSEPQLLTNGAVDDADHTSSLSRFGRGLSRPSVEQQPVSTPLAPSTTTRVGRKQVLIPRTSPNGSCSPLFSSKPAALPRTPAKTYLARTVASSAPAESKATCLSQLLAESLESLQSRLHASLATKHGEVLAADRALIELLAMQRLQQLTRPPSPPPAPCYTTPSLPCHALLCPLLQAPSPTENWVECKPPEPHEPPPVPMPYRRLSIGKGSHNDVDLQQYGHCNYISKDHACVMLDEYACQYELLCYSHHGTEVDGVVYRCDESMDRGPPQPPQATSLVVQVRDLVQKHREHYNKHGAPDYDFTLKDEGGGGAKAGDRQSADCGRKNAMTSNPGQEVYRCGCPRLAKRETRIKSGWEGPAALRHGSYLRFGCIKFVFSIVETASKGNWATIAEEAYNKFYQEELKQKQEEAAAAVAAAEVAAAAAAEAEKAASEKQMKHKDIDGGKGSGSCKSSKDKIAKDKDKDLGEIKEEKDVVPEKEKSKDIKKNKKEKDCKKKS